MRKFLIAAAVTAASVISVGAVGQPRVTVPKTQLQVPNDVLTAIRQGRRPPRARTPTPREYETIGYIPIQTATINWGAVLALNAGSMDGWTALTNGATQGGASVVRLKDNRTLVIVRAGDGKLYEAQIDPANPGTLPASAWRATGIAAGSEPHCEANGQEAGYFCAYTGPNGSARATWIEATWKSSEKELGGSGAGARPTVTPGPYTHYVPTVTSFTSVHTEAYTLLVWDGADGLWRYRAFDTNYTSGFGASAPESQLPADEQGWKRIAGNFGSPLGCASRIGSAVRCAVVSGGGIGSINLTQLNPDNIVGKSLTKPVPGGTSKTAPALVYTQGGQLVYVVRNATGRLYRQLGGNPSADWVDEGGSARQGSNISCTAVNEQPVCFIQGPDGRIWWKRMGTASGL